MPQRRCGPPPGPASSDCRGTNVRDGSAPWPSCRARRPARCSATSCAKSCSASWRARTRIPLFSRICMGYAISLWAPPALPIAGSAESFPVRRIFCVGRNYAEHQKEMGGDGRETPFFFLKTEFALVPVSANKSGEVHYPAKSSNYHYETELVVALHKGGRRIDAKRANAHIYG